MPTSIRELPRDRKIFTVRGGPKHRDDGDPYTWTATIVEITDHAVEIQAMVSRFGNKFMDDMDDLKMRLKKLGYKRAYFERKNTANDRITFIDLKE